MRLPPRPALLVSLFSFRSNAKPPASPRLSRATPQRLLLREQRRRRALLVTVGAAAVLLMSLLTTSGNISTVYANELAPASAQDSGLPAPPTDASGNALPPIGTTVPRTVTALENLQPGEALLTMPQRPGVAQCAREYHSSDGNPYPICPGPQPLRGGNCTWWAWEQWHNLGYNLPAWGNAAYWAMRAEQYGLQVGTVPRINALVVFPRGDGVWAWDNAGHVAFVTQVYSDLDTFDVTYENYGDPTLVHYGKHYRVSIIQQPRFQNGQMRFIYFPGTAGTPGNTPPSASNITSPDVINNYVADFAGDGQNEILRYNRTKGTMDFLRLSDNLKTVSEVPLESDQTRNGNWGSDWEVYVGNFNADPSGRASLLLYDRKHGFAHFITLYHDLSVANDVVQTNWKPTWEIFVGSFDGSHDQLLFYDRELDKDHGQWTPAPGEPAVPAGVNTGADGNASTNPTPDANDSDPKPYDPNSSDWAHHHRTATLALVDYNNDFTVRHQVTFDRWHNTFEVRIGQFGQAGRDGILFFDRKAGELVVVSFDGNLRINATHQQHKVSGNWEIYPGDYDGTLQDSLFFFDRTTGKAQMVAFNPNLTLRRQVTYSNWGKGWEFHTGHFGGPSSAAVSLLMYGRSTGILSFVGFNPNLGVARQARYSGFGSNWTVFVGQFGAPCTNLMGGSSTATPTNTPTPAATSTSTPTATPTPNPNTDDAPPSPSSGTTVTVNQSCTDSVLLVNEANGKARLIFFAFDNGLRNGKPTFIQVTVPWITPTPTSTPTTTSAPTPTPTPSPTPTPTPSPTPSPTPMPGPAPNPTPSPTPTPTSAPPPTATPSPAPTP